MGLKGTIVLGHVIRNNVPMFMTFDAKDVAYVVESLGNAIEMGYKVYAMFSEDGTLSIKRGETDE